MSGNSIHTAKSIIILKLLEVLQELRFLSVDVYGNILEEKDVEDLNPVEDGLGGCNQRGCVIEEEQYECLICPHFATTANRIPLFKTHNNAKTLKESTLNSQERYDRSTT